MQLFAGLIRLETVKFVCLLKSQADDSAASSQLAGTFWMLRATAAYEAGKRLYKETKYSKALLYMPQVILQLYIDMIRYDIFVNCNWVVTRWQCTFTHKKYTER